VLETLRNLFVATRLAGDEAFFVSSGFLSGDESQSISGCDGVIDVLCDALAPRVLDLVLGFGIPECSVTAPIAQQGWMSYYGKPEGTSQSSKL
jgi:hypothetical protein